MKMLCLMGRLSFYLKDLVFNQEDVLSNWKDVMANWEDLKSIYEDFVSDGKIEFLFERFGLIGKM